MPITFPAGNPAAGDMIDFGGYRWVYDATENAGRWVGVGFIGVPNPFANFEGPFAPEPTKQMASYTGNAFDNPTSVRSTPWLSGRTSTAALVYDGTVGGGGAFTPGTNFPNQGAWVVNPDDNQIGILFPNGSDHTQPLATRDSRDDSPTTNAGLSNAQFNNGMFTHTGGTTTASVNQAGNIFQGAQSDSNWMTFTSFTGVTDTSANNVTQYQATISTGIFAAIQEMTHGGSTFTIGRGNLIHSPSFTAGGSISGGPFTRTYNIYELYFSVVAPT